MRSITLIIIFYAVALAPHKAVFAKSKRVQDTVYYLLDTAKTPPNERMWTIANANPHQFYTIKCPCLRSNQLPVFRGNINKLTTISMTDVEKLKLIHLSDLIELVRKNDNADFEKKITLFFIIVSNNTYQKQQVFFLGSKETKMQ
jgi:hypothetical protein